MHASHVLVICMLNTHSQCPAISNDALDYVYKGLISKVNITPTGRGGHGAHHALARSCVRSRFGLTRIFFLGSKLRLHHGVTMEVPFLCMLRGNNFVIMTADCLVYS